MAHVIVKRMSSFVRQIDFALEWNLIEAGASLFRFLKILIILNRFFYERVGVQIKFKGMRIKKSKILGKTRKRKISILF